jgi:hypothetical protein
LFKNPTVKKANTSPSKKNIKKDQIVIVKKWQNYALSTKTVP